MSRYPKNQVDTAPVRLERTTRDGADLRLPGGRVLRIELHRHPEGEPAELVLSLGYGEPGTWHDRAETLVLPGEIVHHLRRELERLAGGNRP